MNAGELKHYCGIFLLCVAVYLIPLHLYLYYVAFSTRNYYLMSYLAFIIVLSLSVKKSQTFIKLVQFFQGEKTYFKEMKIICEEEIPKNNCLFGIHPHGLYCLGLLVNLHTKCTLFENLTCLASRLFVFIPFLGLLFKLWGVEGVHSQNLRRLMKNGQNAALVPGGYEEASLTTKTENRLFLKGRKGFIKYALEYGTTIFPVFTFGENQMFHTLDKFIKLRLFLNKYKIAAAVFWSKFGLLPDPNSQLITVVGKGIRCPKTIKPTKEEINRYHQIYTQAVIDLYDKYSPTYAPNIKLKIF